MEDQKVQFPGAFTFFVNRLRNQNKAVSPVIGVILMVAITVILASIVGAAVLSESFGQPNNSPVVKASVTTNLPNATIQFGGELNTETVSVAAVSEGDTEINWEEYEYDYGLTVQLTGVQDGDTLLVRATSRSGTSTIVYQGEV